MWYVIQTMVGEEENVLLLMNVLVDKEAYVECFIPRYENVWMKQGKANVSVEKLFTGYVFIETETPERVFDQLKKVPTLTKLINDGDSRGYQFLAMDRAEEVFYREILDQEHILRLTYLHRGKDSRADKAMGPMGKYLDSITKVDWHHRRAFAKVMLLGEERSIRFGITLDKPQQENIENDKKHTEEIENKSGQENIDWWDWKARQSALRDNKINKVKKQEKAKEQAYIHPGEKVKMTEDIYGGKEYEVISSNEQKQTVTIAVPMFGTMMKIEVPLTDVELVEDEG